eukprot:scaffold18420_cov48-Attheya_sp.AAC.2
MTRLGAREDLLADLDMRELLAVYALLRPCCYCHGRGWVGVGFVDISLEREEWWEVGQNCLLGQYDASGGVWHSRLAKEGGLNEGDNSIMLQ